MRRLCAAALLCVLGLGFGPLGSAAGADEHPANGLIGRNVEVEGQFRIIDDEATGWSRRVFTVTGIREVRSEGVRVEIRGILRTGMVGFPGEHTGTVITANGISWQVDLGQDPKLQALALQLHGKQAVVCGEAAVSIVPESGSRIVVACESLNGLVLQSRRFSAFGTLHLGGPAEAWLEPENGECRRVILSDNAELRQKARELDGQKIRMGGTFMLDPDGLAIPEGPRPLRWEADSLEAQVEGAAESCTLRGQLLLGHRSWMLKVGEKHWDIEFARN